MILSDLENKVILITGALRGIGRGIALSLAKQKAYVVFNYRNQQIEEAKILKDEIESLGGKSDFLKFDVTHNQEIVDAINDFVKNKAVISGLVNNAGISKDQIVLRLKEEDLDQTLNTNLRGSILVTAALSRSFLKAEHVSVVNISSIAGLMGNPSQISYAASKAGLLGFTKSYAKELASRNIRCNAICPGFIETDMTKNLDKIVQEKYLSSIPLGRYGSVQEVTNLTCFLLSQASSYITGEIIKIDGGIYI